MPEFLQLNKINFLLKFTNIYTLFLHNYNIKGSLDEGNG